MRGNELWFVFFLTKLLVCVRLYLVENVKVFAHLLSGGDNDNCKYSRLLMVRDINDSVCEI